ncbi:MAG: type IV pilus twitching motility protein PilT [Firmicutes bacterium]|nr:type IV pilus twitching motility protein PilT [Bacillota bacterium]
MLSSQLDSTYPLSINQLLEITVNRNASDLHLVVGYPPAIRVAGDINVLDYPAIKPRDMEGLLLPILEEWQLKRLKENLELDFSYAIEGLARFRGNIMLQRGTYAAAFRAVPFVVPKFDDLGLLPEIKELCNLSRGLVLVTGPTGSGKSTTLAALIDIINNTRRLNIVTIEDPIEFLHRHNKSTVRQREIGLDTHSFVNALRHVLRHDPDVIMIGEMRDLESISIALTAAETGHLVFSTLHTQTAPLTISRIVDIFTHEKREQVRQQLANSLQAIISQQLVPLIDRSGRVVAVEYMVSTPAVRNLIREGREHQLYSTIQTGHSYGMQTMDQALVKLYNKGKISRESVLEYCIDKQEVERLMRQAGV